MLNNLLRKVFGFLRLTHEQEDHALIHESIEKGIVFRGTNLWILIFANFIASVGLNMNSTAVIIGAMLISPLMGPINGIGYSIATYDFTLLRKSLKNYSFSVLGGLAASTLYFMITPIHTEHSELLARTSPTIYDVFIAMFGGLAGIVAISSKNKGNVIPGVAIATALMPPLCTAGYGISIGNWAYFMGAMYLFLINTVFIGLAAMLVSQLLKFPKREFLLAKEIKNTNIVVGIVILLTVAPSLYLGITLVRKERFNGTAKKFVQKVTVWEDNYLLRSSIDDKTREIRLAYVGNEFDKRSEERLKDKAKDMGLEDAKLHVEQGVRTGNNEDILKVNSEFDQLTSKIVKLESVLDQKNGQIDSLMNVTTKGHELLGEIKSLYPQINGCSFSQAMRYSDSTHQSVPVSMVYLSLTEELKEEDMVKIENWVKHRLNTENVILKF